MTCLGSVTIIRSVFLLFSLSPSVIFLITLKTGREREREREGYRVQTVPFSLYICLCVCIYIYLFSSSSVMTKTNLFSCAMCLQVLISKYTRSLLHKTQMVKYAHFALNGLILIYLAS